jgi:FtsZ-interacting cell division protein ZipA
MEPQIQPQMQPQENKSSIGSIIGTIIIIAIIILGGLYFWGKRIEESKVQDDLLMQSATTSEEVVPENVSTSDDVNSIEADLNATADFGGLGAELE